MELRVVVHLDPANAYLNGLPARVEQAVDTALGRAGEEMARGARRFAPKAFSTLTNSIHHERLTPLHHRVVTGVNYARPVEEGRRPGKMPGTANGLEEWVRQKLRPPEDKLKDVTFRVARGIAARGIQPQPYMRPAAEAGTGRLHELVMAAVQRGLEPAHV